jgi:hypothetical protein
LGRAGCRGCWSVAEDLLAMAKADTCYADLYLQRARALVANGEDVRVRAIAARVRGFDEDLVDPFSPGTSELAGVPISELAALRDATLRRLDRLRVEDSAWADLYAARRMALGDARVVAISAAVAALEARAGPDDGGAPPLPAPPPPVLARPFPIDACVRALKLGLTPYRAPSEEEQIRAKLRPGWRVSPSDPGGNTVRLSVTIPGDADQPLREALALFMNRAFLTSAGTRYVPWCVDENVLVETFDERPPGAAEAPSPVVAALGLRTRTGLTRSELEKALRERGPSVVRNLGLDPREHRIVCIPADVYLRLGARLGWGRRETWTHFDGYMVSERRKLMPLAGGDVRFGGLHDLVALGAGYASDRLVARFAVVQRRRFAAL